MSIAAFRMMVEQAFRPLVAPAHSQFRPVNREEPRQRINRESLSAAC